MPVTDLIPALQGLQAGRYSVDDLLAACAEWVRDPAGSLTGLLEADVPLATAVQRAGHGPTETVGGAPSPESTTDHLPNAPDPDGRPPATTASARFVPQKLHARGGMGRVWIARDDALGREVAFKDLRPNRDRDERASQRFLREAVITGRLEHPGVVPVYAVGTKPNGGPFYTMRLIQGRTLGD